MRAPSVSALLAVLALLSLGPPVGFASETATSQARRPDILLISVDTLRADHLSSYGYEKNTSPFLDRLFADSVTFTDARTVVPLTGPAFASLLTSLHPHQHGATRNGLPMRENLVSFTRILARRGWRTAAFVGNWTLKPELTGFAEHFDTYETILNKKRWFGLAKSEATAEDVSEQALEWLDGFLDGDAQRPFLLWVHYVEPHAPYKLRREYLKQIGSGAGAAFSARLRYDTEIAYIDDHIADFLERYRARVGRRDTLVVFVSDHGESLGNHGYWGHGRHVYDVTLRVPMSVQWRGALEPRKVDSPSLILDLAPTILGLVGLPTPEFFEGLDWGPVLRGEAEAPAGRVTLFQSHRSAVQPKEDRVRLREKGLLEVARVESGRKEIYRVTNRRRRLFELGRDAEELMSLAPLRSDPTPELASWLAEVREGLARADELPLPTLSEEDLEALRALGYID